MTRYAIRRDDPDKDGRIQYAARPGVAAHLGLWTPRVEHAQTFASAEAARLCCCLNEYPTPLPEPKT